ncbi:MAG: hypothetical protein RL226_1173, partial [Bacteroidota bacterium]
TNHLGGRIWTKSSGTPNDDALSCMTNYDATHLLIGGTTQSINDAMEGVIIKLNHQAEEVWQKTISGPLNEDVRDLLVMESGKIIAIGTTTSFSDNQNVDWWICSLDGDGNTLWTSTFGTDMYENILSVTADEDGNLYLWGHQNGPETTGYDGVLVKLDVQGNEVWTRTFSLGANELAWDIVYMPEGDLLLSGDTNSAGQGGNDTYLIRLTTDGDVVWSKTFGSWSNDHGTSIVHHKNDMYMLNGGTASVGNGGIDYMSLFVNAMGDIKYTSTYGGDLKDIATTSIRTMDAGALLLGNTRSFGEGLYSALAVKIDQDARGACMSNHTTEFVAEEIQFNIGNAVFTNRGEGITVQNTAFPSFAESGLEYFVLCDNQIEGVVPSHISDVDEISHNRLTLQPNPSNGYVRATVLVSDRLAGKLELFNLEGRKVKEIMIPVGNAGEVRSYDISGLPEGIYLSRLSIGNQLETKKLIVE